MGSKPYFSFIFCLNKENRYTFDSIDSMLKQSYDEYYEIIIVANACTDMLFERLKSIADKYHNIFLYRTDIGQLAFNLNFAANYAKGQYLVRMDADDECLFDRLKLTKERLVERDFPDVLCGGADFIDEKDQLVKSVANNMFTDEIYRKLKKGNCLVHPCVAIKKSTFLKVRAYAGGIVCEDYDLWLRMMRGGYRIETFDDRILRYRLHPEQSRGNINGPADGVGYLIREFLLTNKISYLIGFFKRLVTVIYMKMTIKKYIE